MKKRFIAIVLSLSVIFCMTCPVFANAADFSGYTGISTAAELADIANNMSGNYYLENDIVFDSSEPNWTPISSTSTAAFKGILDGNGYSIIGLNTYVNSASSTTYGGIFKTNNGTVKNLNIVDAVIEVDASKYFYGGLVAGISVGTIENVRATGQINISSDGVSSFVGGIAGNIKKGTITDCFTDVTITASGASRYSVGGIVGDSIASVSGCFAKGDITVTSGGSAFVGGICGNATSSSSSNGSITDCANIGDISVESGLDVMAGGIIGQQGSKEESGGKTTYRNCSISNTYNMGTVSGHSNAQGFVTGVSYVGAVAGNKVAGSESNCFVLNNTSAKLFGNGEGTAQSLTDSEMRLSANFTGFDFTDIWSIGSQTDYSYPLQKAIVKNRDFTGEGISYDFEKKYVNITEEKTWGTQKALFDYADYMSASRGDTALDASGKLATGDRITLIGVFGGEKTAVVKFEGDVNGDTNVSVTDIVATRSHILGTNLLDGVYYDAANLVVDGTLSVSDIVGIRNIILG